MAPELQVFASTSDDRKRSTPTSFTRKKGKGEHLL